MILPECPRELELEELLAGECPPGRAREIESHAAECSTCSGWLERARSEDELLGDVRRALEGEHRARPAEPEEEPALARYEILSRLGVGGMGIVYEARQKNPERTVALKVLQPGRSTPRALLRFEHEAEVLARLDHPGIARVFEAGTYQTAGGTQPFFAMERVDGRPITEHAREAGLDVRARLALFASVCDAVQHAHQKGVVHRDLKPSNLLVTPGGEPKVLDFGVARLTDGSAGEEALTLTGEVVGTLAYMSPEQAAGRPDEIDTRTDVYALGAVLYELLGGRPPHRLSGRPTPEALRVLAHEDPVPLGRVDPRLAGDLDAIVRKALSKERARRYPTAAALAEDLRRFLRRETVEARPPTVMYRLSSFARRNRGLVAAGVVVLVVLIAGVVATTGQARRALAAERRAEDERDEARLEAERSRRVRDFLAGLLAEVDPQVGGKGPGYTVREALDESAWRLDESLPDDPAVEADLRLTIGEAYLNLQRFEESEVHLARALELATEAHGAASAEVVAARAAVGVLRTRQRRLDEAEQILEEALELYERIAPDDDLARAGLLENLATVRFEAGDLDGAEARLDEAGALRRRALGDDHPDAWRSVAFVALLRKLGGRTAEAEALVRDALVWSTDVLGEAHPTTASYRKQLADLLADAGREAEEAESLYREALATFTGVLGPEHARTAGCAASLAHHVFFDDEVEAERLFRQALPVMRGDLPPDDLFLHDAREGLTVILGRRGAFGEAAELHRAWLADFDGHPEADPEVRSDVMFNYARCLRACEDREKAERLLRSELEEALARGGPDDPFVARLRVEVARGSRDVEEVERLLHEALAVFDATGDDSRAREVRALLAQLGLR